MADRHGHDVIRDVTGIEDRADLRTALISWMPCRFIRGEEIVEVSTDYWGLPRLFTPNGGELTAGAGEIADALCFRWLGKA